jgi:hypothetical protein
MIWQALLIALFAGGTMIMLIDMHDDYVERRKKKK